MSRWVIGCAGLLSSYWLAEHSRRFFIFTQPWRDMRPRGCHSYLAISQPVGTFSCDSLQILKGLSHEIFGPVYWPVWIHLGLNKNRFWFINFKEALSVWGRHFKFWCVSVQTFPEILRISEKDWQLWTQLPILLRELGTQLPIILGDSTILREIFTP
jgi:hypothetical protein